MLRGLGDLLKLVAAELLAGLGLQDVSVLGSSFIQSLVGVLIVHQSPAPPVQQVLQPQHQYVVNVVLPSDSSVTHQNLSEPPLPEITDDTIHACFLTCC